MFFLFVYLRIYTVPYAYMALYCINVFLCQIRLRFTRCEWELQNPANSKPTLLVIFVFRGDLHDFARKNADLVKQASGAILVLAPHSRNGARETVGLREDCVLF